MHAKIVSRAPFPLTGLSVDDLPFSLLKQTACPYVGCNATRSLGYTRRQRWFFYLFIFVTKPVVTEQLEPLTVCDRTPDPRGGMLYRMSTVVVYPVLWRVTYNCFCDHERSN